MLTVSNFTNYLFYLLLALLPFNLRHIFNFEQVKDIEGFHEHLSWSLYAFDIVFIILLISFLIGNYKRLRTIFNVKILLLAIATLVVIVLSSYFSKHPLIATYQSIRLTEAIIFFFISKEFLKDHLIHNNSIAILFFSGIIQSFIAIGQFGLQRSLGLKLLGESLIAPDILGVAKIEVMGEKLIRAYGMFPHPNLLGAYLLMTLVCGLYLWHFKIDIFKDIRLKRLLWPGIMLIIIGIILTFSRSAWLAAILLLLGYVIFYLPSLLSGLKPSFKNILSASKYKFLAFIVFIFFLFYLFFPFFSARFCLTSCPNDNSYALRKLYNQAAFKLITQKPLLGVGPGNFVPGLEEYPTVKIHDKYTFPTYFLRPWEYQPAHNLYLLAASEIGLFGFVLLLLLSYSHASLGLPCKKKLFLSACRRLFIAWFV